MKVTYLHHTYYDIAQDAIEEAIGLSYKTESMTEIMKLPEGEEKNEKFLYMTSLYTEIKKREIDIFIHSALFIESFINFYAVFKGIKYRKKFESSLSTLHKWIIYPFLSNKEYLKNDVIDKVGKIMASRNHFVHFKPKMKMENKFKYSLAEAIQNFNSINLFIGDLNRIDDKVKKDRFNKVFSIPECVKNISMEYIAYCNC